MAFDGVHVGKFAMGELKDGDADVVCVLGETRVQILANVRGMDVFVRRAS